MFGLIGRTFWVASSWMVTAGLSARAAVAPRRVTRQACTRYRNEPSPAKAVAWFYPAEAFRCYVFYAPRASKGFEHRGPRRTARTGDTSYSGPARRGIG